MSGVGKLALLAAGVLALFAILFTAGSALGVWPLLPPGAFLGWDLWVGLAVGLVLLVSLVRRNPELGIENQEPEARNSRF